MNKAWKYFCRSLSHNLHIPVHGRFLGDQCNQASRSLMRYSQLFGTHEAVFNWRGSGHVSRKVARLLDSFRPGSTSYCPFPGKNFEADGNNNHRPPPFQPPAQPFPLLRPSEVPVERPEFRTQPLDIPPTTQHASPPSTPPSLVSYLSHLDLFFILIPNTSPSAWLSSPVNDSPIKREPRRRNPSAALSPPRQTSALLSCSSKWSKQSPGGNTSNQVRWIPSLRNIWNNL